jgi:hypothetical protein
MRRARRVLERRPVSWEQRLREMVLAGGALATVACGGATERSAFDAGSSQPTDATTDQVSNDDVASSSNPCCNADPDPCCAYQYCEASLSPQCVQEMECQEAGRWNSNTYTCEAPPRDAGARDADSAAPDAPAPDASTDAPDDAAGD